MRTCSAWALPLGVAHQGISLTGGHALLCEFQTLWDPSSQNFARQKKFQDMGVCAYICWCMYVWRGVWCMCVCMCVCLGVSLLSLPLAWGSPGESLEL